MADPSRLQPRRVARLLLVVAVAGSAGFAYGFLVHRHHVFPYELVTGARAQVLAAVDSLTGRRRASLIWRPVPTGATAPLDRDTASRLEALGYLQGYESAPGKSGVLRNLAERTQPGLNLYLSGHDSAARLMTMEGAVLHTWTMSYETACPDQHDPDSEQTRFFRRARLLDDGSLLVVFDYGGLVKLDRRSRLVWKRCDFYHHDVAVAEDGTILAIMAKERAAPELYGEPTILDDEIHYLSPSGELRRALSLLDLFRASPYAPVLERRGPKELDREFQGDLFHTNSVKILDGGTRSGPLSSPRGTSW